MHDAHPTPSSADATSADRAVCVARDLDDDRVVFVHRSQLFNPHVATDCGGRRQPLSRPAIGGYIDRALIPAGVPFGHSG